MENKAGHNQNRSTIGKRIASFGFAVNGIIQAVKSQPNFRIHLLIMALVVFAGFYLNISLWEWTCVIFAIGLVLVAELFNTAIETLTDLVSPDYHEKAGKTKDYAAGAVLVAAITAAVIGLVIFIPKLL